MAEKTTVWLIGDGKPGHENQSLGLSAAITRRVPCDVHSVSIAGVKGLLKRVDAASRSSAGLPKPDIIIAAGHSTHPSLLWLARKHRARSIVLMRPSLPMSWFDLVIAPDHDFPGGCGRENVILTRGALNRVLPPDGGPRSRGMILIGGPSANHGWDGESLLAALEEIGREGDWELTDSRRTPDGFTGEIRSRVPSITVFPHEETASGWLPEKLAATERVWVTEDSVSMIYEALASGARVGLLPAPRLAEGARVLRGVDDLVAKGYLTPFSRWQKTGELPPPPEVLREADRCAGEIICRLSL